MVLLDPPLGPPRPLRPARALSDPVRQGPLFGRSGVRGRSALQALRRPPDQGMAGTDRRRDHRRPRRVPGRAWGAHPQLLRLQQHASRAARPGRPRDQAGAHPGRRLPYRSLSDGLRASGRAPPRQAPGPVPRRPDGRSRAPGPADLHRIPRALFQQGMRPRPGLHRRGRRNSSTPRSPSSTTWPAIPGRRRTSPRNRTSARRARRWPN